MKIFGKKREIILENKISHLLKRIVLFEQKEKERRKTKKREMNFWTKGNKL